jgi:hypothetical protein
MMMDSGRTNPICNKFSVTHTRVDVVFGVKHNDEFLYSFVIREPVEKGGKDAKDIHKFSFSLDCHKLYEK